PEHGEIKDLASSNARIFSEKMALVSEDFSERCSLEKCGAGIFACKDHFARKSPITFIEITPRCNMNCPVCYIDASIKGADIPLEDIKKMISEIKVHDPETHLVLIGGEPTIHRDFFKILEAVKEAGLMKRCYLATNGITLADEKFCRKVYDAGIRWYYLAFDSVDKETCKKIRGSYRSYEAVRKTIENLRKFRRPKIVLSIAVVKGVNDKELSRVVEFAVENSDVVRRVSISAEVFCGRQTSTNNLLKNRITPECIESILEKDLNINSPTVSLASYGILLKPLSLAGFLPRRTGLYTMPHPLCGNIGFVGRDKNGSYFSAIDLVVKNPSRNLYRYSKRIENFSVRMAKSKERFIRGSTAGKALWKLEVYFYYMPVYLGMLLSFIKPSFIFKAAVSFIKSIFAGEKTGGILFTKNRVEIHYLIACDKYNFVWEKMPYCATHHYRINPGTKKVTKMCGCYVFPFRSYADSCHAMG
ncbi:MAG: radical SAM protein, partial [Candidatus Auribacterota bacterium]|nr:radical SAM protein [Candidatus Auribacterota bacterium]